MTEVFYDMRWRWVAKSEVPAKIPVNGEGMARLSIGFNRICKIFRQHTKKGATEATPSQMKQVCIINMCCSVYTFEHFKCFLHHLPRFSTVSSNDVSQLSKYIRVYAVYLKANAVDIFPHHVCIDF